MDLQSRVDELRAMPWQDIRDAAEAVGVEKSDDATWKDMADDIAIAESIQSEAAIAPVEAVGKRDYSQSFYAKSGIPYCVNCGSKRCTDSDGVVIDCCDTPEFSDAHPTA